MSSTVRLKPSHVSRFAPLALLVIAISLLLFALLPLPRLAGHIVLVLLGLMISVLLMQIPPIQDDRDNFVLIQHHQHLVQINLSPAHGLTPVVTNRWHQPSRFVKMLLNHASHAVIISPLAETIFYTTDVDQPLDHQLLEKLHHQLCAEHEFPMIATH
ncbi:hypothetical protein [Thaumasiovibrio sp. DFM-14]|uniref:hypothetical protein n=1 Tax=Thaumasiovibrio sp. DFM-14 TaxID=3384792 RepID=UPI0039A3B730